ncbi:Hypothetical predicted protein [Marmota monax]|uniref:Uncharacterized protein n=1 Tax=Marmota monax TaxID=9995 RepID=A0A5E4BPX9_MARMO|nr:Hypothetical predicted protein [Marmota monax]
MCFIMKLERPQFSGAAPRAERRCAGEIRNMEAAKKTGLQCGPEATEGCGLGGAVGRAVGSPRRRGGAGRGRAGGRQARRALPADDECPPELRGPRAGWQLVPDVLETWSALKRGLGLPGLEWKGPAAWTTGPEQQRRAPAGVPRVVGGGAIPASRPGRRTELSRNFGRGKQSTCRLVGDL